MGAKLSTLQRLIEKLWNNGKLKEEEKDTNTAAGVVHKKTEDQHDLQCTEVLYESGMKAALVQVNQTLRGFTTEHFSPEIDTVSQKITNLEKDIVLIYGKRRTVRQARETAAKVALEHMMQSRPVVSLSDVQSMFPKKSAVRIKATGEVYNEIKAQYPWLPSNASSHTITARMTVKDYEEASYMGKVFVRLSLPDFVVSKGFFGSRKHKKITVRSDQIETL